MKTRVSVLLWLVLLCAAPVFAAGDASTALLAQDAPAGKILPRNFRTCAFSFRAHEGLPPSREGLDTLRISGSAQFSPGQLDALAANLPGPVTVVDLRRESHGMLGDVAVSWYAPHNQGNPGLNAPAVAAAEAGLLAGIDERPDVAVATRLDKGSDGDKKTAATTAMGSAAARSEADALAARGLGTLRVAVSDHTRPDDAAVDRFVRFFRDLAPGVWLHFHCRAGQGRTTTFMAMADMLANAGRVSCDDILRRQWLLGGVDLTEIAGKKERAELARQRLDFLHRFYDYAKANPGARSLLWSAWLAGQGRP